MIDIKSQYQTALTLGTPFAKDAFPGSRRRRGRDHAYWRYWEFYKLGVTRSHTAQQGYGADGSQDTGTQGVLTGTVRGAGVPILDEESALDILLGHATVEPCVDSYT